MAAHRCILASRSEFFKALLTGGMKETDQSEVHIGEVSKEVLILFTFLYTDSVEVDGDNIVATFIAADRFNLESLRELMVQQFRLCLSVENVLELLLATQGMSQLATACKEFILEHYNLVASQPAFETLPQHLLVEFIRASLKK